MRKPRNNPASNRGHSQALERREKRTVGLAKAADSVTRTEMPSLPTPNGYRVYFPLG